MQHIASGSNISIMEDSTAAFGNHILSAGPGRRMCEASNCSNPGAIPHPLCKTALFCSLACMSSINISSPTADYMQKLLWAAAVQSGRTQKLQQSGPRSTFVLEGQLVGSGSSSEDVAEAAAAAEFESLEVRGRRLQINRPTSSHIEPRSSSVLHCVSNSSSSDSAETAANNASTSFDQSADDNDHGNRHGSVVPEVCASRATVHLIGKKRPAHVAEDGDDDVVVLTAKEVMPKTKAAKISHSKTAATSDRASTPPAASETVRWTEDMDDRLRQIVGEVSDGVRVPWVQVAELFGHGVDRHHCFNRWAKYADPALASKKTGNWDVEEEALLVRLVAACTKPGSRRDRDFETDWESVGQQLNRTKKDCINKWNCIRSLTMKKGPFTVIEDELILSRKAEWTAEGKMRGLWASLEREMSRPGAKIRLRWSTVLSKTVSSDAVEDDNNNECPSNNNSNNSSD